MPKHLTATETLEAIIKASTYNPDLQDLVIESEAEWFEVEAQATISINSDRYAITLQPIP